MILFWKFAMFVVFISEGKEFALKQNSFSQESLLSLFVAFKFYFSRERELRIFHWSQMNEFAHGQIKMRKLDTSLKCIDENYDGHTDQQMDMWSHGEVTFPIMSGRQGSIIYILAISPQAGNFCPQWKPGQNLKEDLKKGKEKGEKKKKHMLKYIYEA